LIEDPNSDCAEIVKIEILPVSEGTFPGEKIKLSLSFAEAATPRNLSSR